MRTSSTYEPRRRPCLRVQYPIRHGKACMQRPCMVPPLLPRARPAVHAVTARSPPPPPHGPHRRQVSPCGRPRGWLAIVQSAAP
jgi:hypothetical protein